MQTFLAKGSSVKKFNFFEFLKLYNFCKKRHVKIRIRNAFDLRNGRPRWKIFSENTEQTDHIVFFRSDHVFFNSGPIRFDIQILKCASKQIRFRGNLEKMVSPDVEISDLNSQDHSLKIISHAFFRGRVVKFQKFEKI